MSAKEFATKHKGKIVLYESYWQHKPLTTKLLITGSIIVDNDFPCIDLVVFEYTSDKKYLIFREMPEINTLFKIGAFKWENTKTVSLVSTACECGAAKCKTTHSSWCPAANK